MTYAAQHHYARKVALQAHAPPCSGGIDGADLVAARHDLFRHNLGGVRLAGTGLAVNAEKATGFNASRELPVIWAITKGSVINKLIILPLAFLLSAYATWAIMPILLIGGAYLSYEGAEKVLEWFGQHAKPPIAAPFRFFPALNVCGRRQRYPLLATGSRTGFAPRP